MRKNQLLKGALALAVGGMALIMIAVAILAAALLLDEDDANGTPVVEAGGMWFGWLYNPVNETFVRVYEDGSSETHTIPLQGGDQFGGQPNAFAPNGEWLAFCAWNESSQTRTLYVHSFNPTLPAPEGVTFPVTYPMATRTECAIFQDSFDIANPARLAIGVVNYFPGDPNADTSRPQWELLIFDMTQNAIIARLDANLPNAAQLYPYDSDRGVWMPLVHRFEGDQVIFELGPWGTEYIPGQKVMAWQVGTQNVTPADNVLGNYSLQTHPVSGERAWLAEDPTRPAAQPMGPSPAFNVVMYQPSAGAQPYAIYHDPAVIPSQLAYIKGGEALFIYVTPGFDPNAPPDQIGQGEWLVLQRDGTVSPVLLSEYTYRVAGLHDGFAAFESNY